MNTIIKKISTAIISNILIFSVINVAFADTIITNSDTHIYKNINGDFTTSNTYHYSSDDKSENTHKIVFTVNSNNVNIDGKIIIIDVSPYIDNGKMMLPLRAVTEILKTFKNNVNINWNSQDKKVVIIYNGKEIIFTASNNIYTVNEEKRTMSGSTPNIKDGRIFIPIREIVDVLNLNINWTPSNKEITITN